MFFKTVSKIFIFLKYPVFFGIFGFRNYNGLKGKKQGTFKNVSADKQFVSARNQLVQLTSNLFQLTVISLHVVTSDKLLISAEKT
jgi:hypothetical protein